MEENEIVYQKLIRDKIPNIIEAEGKTPIVHRASKDEYLEKLYEKIIEELNEFISNPSKEEIADLLEVIHSICSVHGLDMEDIEKVRREKRQLRGGFGKPLILEKVIY